MVKCGNCKHPNASIDLPYLGKTVCNSCFMKIVEKRISKTIKNYKLLEKGDKIAIAISGGKDSSLVLNYLANYVKNGGITLFAIHVSSGDEYSGAGGKMAKSQADALGIDFYEFSFKEHLGISSDDLIEIKTKTKLNMCSICGVFRRHLVNKKAKELGATKVATGHNLTDDAQTYLMNMIRGDLKGFAPLGPKSTPKRAGFVQRIRLLRQVPENEVRKYVELKKIKHTKNPCPHRGGSMRLNIMSVLEEINKFRPGAEFSICKIGDQIAEKIKTKNIALKSCAYCKEPAASDVCRTCKYLVLFKNKNLKSYHSK